MSQKYVAGNQEMFKGLILTGSGLLNDTRTIQEDGTTLFSINTPTLTIGGSKDGLYRVTRGAVSYYHQQVNISPKQAGLHQYVLFDGLSHSSFMDSTMLPFAVKAKDLKPEVEEKVAHNKVANAIVSFIGGKPISQDETKAFLKPLMDGMYLEGSYDMKDPCYDKTLVNRNGKTCLHGSKWTAIAQ